MAKRKSASEFGQRAAVRKLFPKSVAAAIDRIDYGISNIPNISKSDDDSVYCSGDTDLFTQTTVSARRTVR